MSKEIVKQANIYFSGQGIVSLEKDDKIYDLGNCPMLTFYDNGCFTLISESVSKQTNELLMGEYKGEVALGEDENEKFHKFVINNDFVRKYTLHFDGMNVAHSNVPVKAKASVVVTGYDSISLINENIAKFTTMGTWEGDLELYTGSSALPKCTVRKIASLVAVRFSEDFKQENQISDFAFNPNALIAVEDADNNTSLLLIAGFGNAAKMPLPIEYNKLLEELNIAGV